MEQEAKKKSDPHHLQRTWFNRLRRAQTPITVHLFNSPMPLVGVTLIDFDMFTMTFKETFKDAVRLHVLFKHGIVGFCICGNDLATSKPTEGRLPIPPTLATEPCTGDSNPELEPSGD